MAHDNMVVCPEPLAAKAGRDVFAAGGNAADAAVAAAFVQGVTNPLLCGLGGTSLIYYYDSNERKTLTLNAEVEIGSVPVPKQWYGEFVGRSETVGRYIIKSEANQVGHQSVMIPGFVRGNWVLFQRYGSGKLSWAELLAPAIKIAKEGFEVYPYIAAFWKAAVGGDAGDAKPGYPGLMTKMNASTGASSLYLKEGRGYQTGEWLVQSEMGDTLQRLADAGGEDYYTGDIAREIMADFEARGGLFTAEDLRDYAVQEFGSLRAPYSGYLLTTPPLPSSGAQFIEMLKTLSHFDILGMGHNTPEYIDLFARIQRASFSDNVKLKGAETGDANEQAKDIIGDDRAAYWADRIKSGDRIQVRGGAVDPGTTHVSVIDDERNVVTMTHSIGSLAGSGVVTSGLGFLFNNFLGHFNPLPGHSDSIEKGKRLGGGVPAIIFKDDEPYLTVGAPGGSRIITSVTQAVVNALNFDMDMKTAVSVPRFHSEEEQLLFLEPAFSEETADELRAKGNEVVRSTYMSRVQAIRVRPDGHLEAGPDPRGGAGVGQYP